MLSDGRIRIGRIRSVREEWDARAGTRGGRGLRGVYWRRIPLPSPPPPLALPPQVQGWRGARHGAVRGSPARASVVSPHYYRYVSASLRSSPRELEARSQWSLRCQPLTTLQQQNIGLLVHIRITVLVLFNIIVLCDTRFKYIVNHWSYQTFISGLWLWIS